MQAIVSPSPSNARRTSVHSTAKWMCILLLVFVVLFPKGGFKVGEIPVTWGYILIFACTVIALPFALLDSKRHLFPRLTCFIFAVLVPFQFIAVLTMAQGVGSLGTAAAGIINFIVIPLAMLVLWRRWYTDEVINAALRVLKFCIFAAAAYGIFLWIMKLGTGKILEVPFLTVNAGDVGGIENKDNLRGGLVMKLVSTYNNGNVYGAATILLLPVFDVIEPRKWRRVILRIALFLTLSRTAWFGLIMDQLLTAGSYILASMRQFPYVNLRRSKEAIASTAVIFVLLVVVVGLAFWLPNGIGMLADQSLSGRSSQLDVFRNFSFLPPGTYDGFAEMVFPSALRQFGAIGFICMTLLFLSPLAFGSIDRTLYASPLRRAAVKGLMLYFLIAWVDGAIDLIPVMAFYWFVTAIAVYGGRPIGQFDSVPALAV